MSSDMPKVGDRVRLVVEGEVTDVFESDHGPAVAIHGYEYYPQWDGASVVSVEVLEQGWLAGDVVRDSEGNVWHRTLTEASEFRAWKLVFCFGQGAWAINGTPHTRKKRNTYRSSDEMRLPLTLLVRGGEAVQS